MARQTISQRGSLSDLRSSSRTAGGVTGAITVDGVGDMLREFKVMPYMIVDKILKKAVYQAAQMFTKNAAQIVPVEYGDLKHSLSTRRKTLQGFRLAVESDTYARRSKATPGGYYAHLVEHGHDIFRTTRWGKYFIKHYAGTKFLTRTAQLHSDEAVQIVKNQVRTGLLLYYSGRKRF